MVFFPLANQATSMPYTIAVGMQGPPVVLDKSSQPLPQDRQYHKLQPQGDADIHRWLRQQYGVHELDRRHVEGWYYRLMIRKRTQYWHRQYAPRVVGTCVIDLEDLPPAVSAAGCRPCVRRSQICTPSAGRGI